MITIENLKAHNNQIQPGKACYGLYLPAFRPESIQTPATAFREVYLGRIRPYDEKAGMAGGGCFQPDKPPQGFRGTAGTHDAGNWVLFISKAEAMAARAILVNHAVRSYQDEIKALEAYL